MAVLQILKGPISLPAPPLTLTEAGLEMGRATDAGLVLADRGVSRRHARIFRQGGQWWVEDLGSSNGTHVNGLKLVQPVPLRPGDQVQVGPFGLLFSDETKGFENVRILSQTIAGPASDEVYQDASGRRLRAMLELTRSLGSISAREPLFAQVAGHLFQLFPRADRMLMLEGKPNELRVTGSQMRDGEVALNQSYSRTLLRRVMIENIGLIASQEADLQGLGGHSLVEMGVQSFVCVPMHDESGKPAGALLLDRFRPGPPFPHDDLMLLTTVAIQVSICFQNYRMQAQLLDQARMQRDLALAREIQQAYLPTLVPVGLGPNHELAAMLNPAQEVAGDFYDYIPVDDTTCLLVVGDVTGKGITAALFLTSVRTLLRHLAVGTRNPGELMQRLNNAIAADNPNGMFVTLALALFESATGTVTLALGGHPAPVRFRPGALAAPLTGPAGRLVGYRQLDRPFPTYTASLQPGEALLFFTDGVTEANAEAQTPPLFGDQRLCTFLATQPAELSLDRIHCNLCDALERYTGSSLMEDDVTLLSIRRRS